MSDADNLPDSASRPLFTPSHGVGQLRRPWQKGQSGNPGGKGALYHTALQLTRDKSHYAAQRLIELMDSKDERVALIASQTILDRAWGKPKDHDPRDTSPAIVLDLSKLTPEQLRVVLEMTNSGAVKPAEEGEAIVMAAVDQTDSRNE